MSIDKETVSLEELHKTHPEIVEALIRLPSTKDPDLIKDYLALKKRLALLKRERDDLIAKTDRNIPVMADGAKDLLTSKNQQIEEAELELKMMRKNIEH